MSAPLGWPRVHLRRAGSTNDRARALAIAGAPHGTVVTAGEQTAGRGRQGRAWSAPPGSALLCSLVLRWPTPDRPAPPLSLIAGVAVCDALDADTLLKWPNDVVVGPGLRKLAGILVEGRPQDGWAVLGIGINVGVALDALPADVRPQAATLGLPRSAIEPTLARLLDSLRRRLGEPAATALDAWRARDALRGREISWSGAARSDGSRGKATPVHTGRAAGVDAEGRLLVELPDGTTTALAAGEVHLRGAVRR